MLVIDWDLIEVDDRLSGRVMSGKLTFSLNCIHSSINLWPTVFSGQIQSNSKSFGSLGFFLLIRIKIKRIFINLITKEIKYTNQFFFETKETLKKSLDNFFLT